MSSCQAFLFWGWITPAWGWTCSYTWQDTRPIEGTFPGKAAYQELREKICYGVDYYQVEISQRYYEEYREGEEIRRLMISDWQTISTQLLPRRREESPIWKETFEETPGVPLGFRGY